MHAGMDEEPIRGFIIARIDGLHVHHDSPERLTGEMGVVRRQPQNTVGGLEVFEIAGLRKTTYNVLTRILGDVGTSRTECQSIDDMPRGGVQRYTAADTVDHSR